MEKTQKFPRTMVGGVSLPRMLIGTNWILGYSHTTQAADKHIRDINCNVEAVSDIACAYIENGVDAFLLPFSEDERCEVFLRGIRAAEEKTGKRMTSIMSANFNVDDTPNARREAEQTIKICRNHGADILLAFHGCVEQLVNKNKRTMDRLPDYLSMIRENGMTPGLSAHMPELIVYSDLNEYDVETYIQIYNCAGFLMQVEVEYIHNVIWNAKKPVLTIKSMAAGRVSPFVGLTFAYGTIRDRDMVAVGAFSRQEVIEDVEISMAALERRRPLLDGRSSPAKTAIIP